MTTTETEPVNAKALATTLNVSLPMLYHYWRRLRQREQSLGTSDPLPKRGTLTKAQAERLIQYVQYRRLLKD